MNFTQFMRPNGRRVPTNIHRPAEIEAKAVEIQLEGYVFESEVLMNGLCSFECIHPTTEHVIAHELCMNGPAVPEAVDKLVNAAYLFLFPEKVQITQNPKTDTHAN